MISIQIKEATKVAHQQLEKAVVLQLKSIRNTADYARLLKNFYTFFAAIEKVATPFISEYLTDIDARRNTDYLKKDLEELGADFKAAPLAAIPQITNVYQAFGAFYVLEGSIMGGPYIVQMLRKYGIQNGLNFFSGYGDQSAMMWQRFTDVLNGLTQNPEQKAIIIKTAGETFKSFGLLFPVSSGILES
jgi:Heme oxygenase